MKANQYFSSMIDFMGWLFSKACILFSAALLLCVLIFSANLLSISKEPYGFIDKTGRLAIPLERRGCNTFVDQRFSRAVTASEGLTVTLTAEKTKRYSPYKCGCELKIPFHSAPDLALLWPRPEDSTWRYVNQNGKVMPWESFSHAEKFSNGLAAVTTTDLKKWHYIDHSGKPAFKGEFQRANTFSEGLATICLKGKWGVIDKTGRLILDSSYNEPIASFKEGFAAAPRRDVNRVDYLGKHGRVAFSVAKNFDLKRFAPDATIGRYLFHTPNIGVSEGLVIFESGGKCGYMDTHGNIAIKPKFYYCWPFSEGRAIIQLEAGGKYGFIDRTGKEITGCKYWDAKSFSEGLAVVRYDSDVLFSHYIDKDGRDAFNRSFPQASSFSNGLAFVGRELLFP